MIPLPLQYWLTQLCTVFTSSLPSSQNSTSAVGYCVTILWSCAKNKLPDVKDRNGKCQSETFTTNSHPH